MKRFITKILVFFICLYIGAWGLDYCICKGLLKMNDSRYQDYAAMLNGDMDNQILIMGSSRSRHHYNPAIIDSLCHTKSFNIGIGGYPLNIWILKYRLYREHNVKPSLVILNIDVIAMRHLHNVSHEHQSEQFFPLIYDKQMRQELKRVGYGFLELNVPLYRMFGYQVVIKNGLFEFLGIKHYSEAPFNKGYYPLVGDWDGTELRKQSPHVQEVPQESVQDLDSFLAECNRDGIEVVLVNSPFYEEAHNIIINYDECNTIINAEAQKYGFQYLDYNKICDINSDSNNFVNSFHMNKESANRFTTLLCDSLLVYMK